MDESGTGVGEGDGMGMGSEDAGCGEGVLARRSAEAQISGRASRQPVEHGPPRAGELSGRRALTSRCRMWWLWHWASVRSTARMYDAT